GWSLTSHIAGMHSENLRCERPPRPLQIRWLRTIFLDVASTPPLCEEGITRPIYNSRLHVRDFYTPNTISVHYLTDEAGPFHILDELPNKRDESRILIFGYTDRLLYRRETAVHHACARISFCNVNQQRLKTRKCIQLF